MTIRFSEIDQFMRCEYAWYLRYVLQLVPKKPAKAPLLGSAVHAGMAAALCSRVDGKLDPLYSGEQAAKGYVQESLAKIAEPEDLDIQEHDDAEFKAPRIVARLLEAFPADKYQTVLFQGKPAVELELTNEGEGPPAIAHLDWVMHEVDTGFNWIVDWKVRKTLQGESEDLDLQAMVYQRLARPVANIIGTMNVQVSAELPATPKVNKDGSMSRAAIRTDWETYRRALVAARLDPDDYLDMKDKLEQVEFLRPVKAARTPEFVDSVWDTVVVPVWQRMMNQTFWQRHLSKFNCSRCPYIPPCLGQLRGEDADWIIETQYNKEVTVISLDEEDQQ